VARAALAPLSAAYASVARARAAAFDLGWLRARALPRPTISVGNLTVGGTGKTPCTIWIAERARAAGARIGILTRGYGGGGADNDEVAMVRARDAAVPIGVGADRAAAARALVEAHPEIDAFVLDDGFQHRRVARDLDLLLVDAADPFGGGACLPRGWLREPASAARRAHAIILTRVDQAERAAADRAWSRLEALGYRGPRVEATHRPEALEAVDSRNGSMSLERLRGRSVRLLSAIARPESFERTVQSLGARVIEHNIFRDHHRYAPADLPDLRDASDGSSDGASICCFTEKDAPKLRRLGVVDGWILRVSFVVERGADDLSRMLEAVWGSRKRTR